MEELRPGNVLNLAADKVQEFLDGSKVEGRIRSNTPRDALQLEVSRGTHETHPKQFEVYAQSTGAQRFVSSRQSTPHHHQPVDSGASRLTLPKKDSLLEIVQGSLAANASQEAA